MSDSTQTNDTSVDRTASGLEVDVDQAIARHGRPPSPQSRLIAYLRDHGGLSRGAKACGTQIAFALGPGLAWPDVDLPMRDLARCLGASRRSVVRWVKELRQAGVLWLERRYRRGRFGVFQISPRYRFPPRWGNRAAGILAGALRPGRRGGRLERARVGDKPAPSPTDRKSFTADPAEVERAQAAARRALERIRARAAPV